MEVDISENEISMLKDEGEEFINLTDYKFYLARNYEEIEMFAELEFGFSGFVIEDNKLINIIDSIESDFFILRIGYEPNSNFEKYIDTSFKMKNGVLKG